MDLTEVAKFHPDTPGSSLRLNFARCRGWLYLVGLLVSMGFFIGTPEIASLALSGLFLLAFGSLGPQFRELPPSNEMGVGFLARGSSILESWLGMIGEAFLRFGELLVHGVAQVLCEGFFYLLFGAGIGIFHFIFG